jgi:predicted nucleotidyltransferase
MPKKLPIPINKRKIQKFCSKYHIISLRLFGSVLTSKFNKKSDVDVLVEFDRKYTPTLFQIVDIEEELSEIFGRTVDLNTPGSLSRFFRNEVLSRAEYLYGG